MSDPGDRSASGPVSGTGSPGGLGGSRRELDRVEIPGSAGISGDTREILDGLNHLLQLDHDAAAAYGIAIERLQDRDHADQIAGFRRDHERHIRELDELIAKLGGTPGNQLHATGPFELAMRSLGGLAGDRGVLMAFRNNELQVRVRYGAYALEATAWPTHVKRLIDQFALDEERHYRWVADVLRRDAEQLEERYAGPQFSGGQGGLQETAMRLDDLTEEVDVDVTDFAERADLARSRAADEDDLVGRVYEATGQLESLAAQVEDLRYDPDPEQSREAREKVEQTRARMSATFDEIEATLRQASRRAGERVRYERLLDIPGGSAPAADAVPVPPPAERMEEEARRVLREHHVLSAPVDPLRIAAGSGIGVHHAAFGDAALVSTVARRGGRASILVQRAVPAEVRRIAIAHALGHYFLHLRDDGDFVDREVDLYRWTGPSGGVVHVRIRDELEANLFSHALLMPEDEVARAMQRRPAAPVPDLAAIFQVPHWLVGFRLAQLGY